MQTIQVIKENGIYSCDIGVSKDEWLEILQDPKTPKEYIETLLRFYYMPEHKGSCKQVSRVQGSSVDGLKISVTKFAKLVRQRLGRFEVVGTDGKPTFWIIPMNNGRELGKDEEGSFEWQLRKELVEALQEYLYFFLVKQYKLLRKEIAINDEHYYELYKWELIKKCKGKDALFIVEQLWKKSINLIDARRDTSVIKYMLNNQRNEYQQILSNLVNDSLPLNTRLRDFKDDMIKALPETMNGKKIMSKANDERTASTILTCHQPAVYTFYKNDVYNRFCKYLGFKPKYAGECFEDFLQLIKPLSKIVEKDQELQEIISESLKGQEKSSLLLAQDVLWMMLVMFPERIRIINKNNDMEPQKKYGKYIDLLLANHNLVLTGAPGTGKTYLAKEIAEEMGAVCEMVQFHPSYDYTDFVEGLRPTADGGFERRDGVFKTFCAKALENFINSKKSREALQQEVSVRELIDDFIDEAIDKETTFETSGTKNSFHIVENGERKITVDIPNNEKTNRIQLPKSDLQTLLENKVEIAGGKEIQEYFKRKYRTQQDSYVYVLYGLLKKLPRKKKAKDVDLVEQKNYVFIIDEINRGEISKIFGELFFSIDPGYRSEKGRVNTQYQNMVEEDDVFKDGFFVPENVYIIGTMNDIDRSVESMDFAMRRRFAWKEVTAYESYVNMIEQDESFAELKEEIYARMQNLNRAILDEKLGLGAAYQIGAAYFRKVAEYAEKNPDTAFQMLWKNHLEGLLREYLRGNRNVEKDLKALEEAYNNTMVEDANSNEGQS